MSQPHDSSTITPALASHRAIPWAGDVRATLLMVLGLLALRLLYQITLCPYGLVGDEAHYWEWSRHPSLSYYTKGPGVGWTILAATTLLGHAEWAIRTPAAIASAVAMFAIYKLATSCAKGDRRAGFLAAALFALSPGYQAVALLMTIDGPYVACWALASWAGWCAMKPGEAAKHGENDDARVIPWACVGAAIGAGFLYKYTILLLTLGLLMFAVLAWRASRSAAGASPQKNWLGPVVALLVMLVCISPVILWNHQHQWPTLRHLLGHLRVEGGDLPVRHETYTPWWTAQFFITQAGLLGPVIAAMVVLCIVRHDSKYENSAEDRATRTYLLCCGLPVVLFYFGVSFWREIEGNWPIAGYVTLLVLVALRLMRELDHHAALTRAWLDSPSRKRVGILRQGPETLWQVLWHWALGVGVVSLLALAYLPAVAALPVVGKRVPLHRLMGQRQAVTELARVIESIRQRDGNAPLIFTDHYSRASTIAYYLPGQPRVFSATSRLGGRRSAYDFFADTDLTSPDLLHKNVVLVGGLRSRWHEAMGFADITPAMIDEPTGSRRALYRDLTIWIATDYQGPLVPAEGTSPGQGQPAKKAQVDDGPNP